MGVGILYVLMDKKITNNTRQVKAALVKAKRDGPTVCIVFSKTEDMAENVTTDAKTIASKTIVEKTAALKITANEEGKKTKRDRLPLPLRSQPAFSAIATRTRTNIISTTRAKRTAVEA